MPPEYKYSRGFVQINRIAVAEIVQTVPRLFKTLAHHFLFEAIMRANWSAGWATNAATPTMLERGQFIMGIQELAEALGSTPRSIRSLLGHLTTLEAISLKTTNKGSIVTICNFDALCPCVVEIDKQPTSNRQATDNSKEVKEVQEHKKRRSTDSYEPSEDARKAVAMWHENRPLDEKHWPTYWKILDDLHRLDKVPWNSDAGIHAIVRHAVTVWGQQHIQSPSKLRLRSRTYPEKKTWEVIQGQLQEPSVPQHAPITWADKRLRELREQRTEQETKDATERRP